MNTYTIDSEETVKQFFKDVHELYPFEWHPDDDFHEYMKEDQKTRVFTDEEAAYLNKVMIKCFDYCDDNDIDIYELAGQVQIDIWREQGKWTK